MHIPIQYTELILLTVAALVSDIRTYKIKNLIIVIFMAAGLTTGFLRDELSGLSDSALAAVIPIPLLMIFFALKMLGAGDIKLFCAIGALGGVRFVLYAMAYSFIAGGIIAIVIMLVNKNFRKRGRYLLCYLKTCFLSRTLQPYTDFNDKTDGAKFRFSYAVACGVAAAIFLKSMK